MRPLSPFPMTSRPSEKARESRGGIPTGQAVCSFLIAEISRERRLRYSMAFGFRLWFLFSHVFSIIGPTFSHSVGDYDNNDN